MEQIDWNNIDAGEFRHEKNHKLQNIPINGSIKFPKGGKSINNKVTDKHNPNIITPGLHVVVCIMCVFVCGEGVWLKVQLTGKDGNLCVLILL